jgi:hypothetical protein
MGEGEWELRKAQEAKIMKDSQWACLSPTVSDGWPSQLVFCPPQTKPHVLVELIVNSFCRTFSGRHLKAARAILGVS